MRNLPETVHEYNIPRLNIWFIVSSLLLLGVIAWMVADDYFREWKPYQRQAKSFEIQSLLQEHARLEKKQAEAGLDAVLGRLAEARAIIDKNAVEIGVIEKQIERLRADAEVKKNELAAEKALLDQRKSEYDEAVERKVGQKKIAAAQSRLREQEARTDQVKRAVEDLESRKNAAAEKLGGFTAERGKQEKIRFSLTREKGLVEKRLAVLNNRLLPMIMDQPLIEFAQPTVCVRQLIVEDQKYSLNFADVPRIDRCITCHTFSDNKDPLPEGEDGFRFANLPQPWRSHPRLDLFVAADSPHPMSRFGCSVCHAGWDRGTTFINAAHTPAFYPVRSDYAKVPLVEGAAHWLPATDVEKWQPGLLAKAQEYAKLTEEKKKLKAASHPDQKRLREVRAAIETARAELSSRHGLDGPALARFESASFTQEQAWQQAPLVWHEMHHKEDPMRPREFIDSSCLKCHQKVTEIPIRKDPSGTATLDPGEKLNAGLRLIEQAGCYACHKMTALETVVKHLVPPTPNRDKIPSKTRTITKPNGEKAPKEILKPAEDLLSIAHRLNAEPEAILALNNLSSPDDLEGNTVLDIPVRVPPPHPAPSLVKIAAKTSREWMRKWLDHPKEFRANTFMPQFWNLDNNRSGVRFVASSTGSDGKPLMIDWADRNAVEQEAITEYLFKISEKPEQPSPPKGDPAQGEKLVNSVGCMGCHVVDQKLADLAFRDRSHRSQGPMLAGSGSKYNEGWLYAWLKNPSQYRHDTRMPNLRLTDQEAADITAWLMSSKNAAFDEKKVPEVKSTVLADTAIDYLKDSMSMKEAVAKAGTMPDEAKLLMLGEKLVQRYGCMNCHAIRGLENAKPISIDLNEWAAKSPTKLDFGFVEVPRNNYAFLHQKLAAPRSLDRVETKQPQELLRMPQYNFTEEQIELIMTAVMGMTGEDPGPKAARELKQGEAEWLVENGRSLIKELNCLGCHINENGFGGAIRRTMDSDQTYLFPPSLQGVGTKVRSDWLHSFLKNPGNHVFRYWLTVRMPTYNLTDDQLNTLTQYFALRDKQPYPHETDVAENLPPPSRETVETGEKILAEAKCMICHQVRTPEAAAAAGNPAINLADVKQRMRTKGLTTWLHNPLAVTPGVNMPSFWPEGQANPLPHILGGDNEKQIQAVADYLRVYGGVSSPRSAAKESPRPNAR